MKTYVLTGSTSGIGKALIGELSRDNIVFAGYRNEKYIFELNAYGKNVVPFYIDMSKPSSIAQAAAFIKSQTGKIDTIINVAGCVVAGAVETIDVNRIREQFEVNTFSHLDLTQRLLEIIDDGGKIINISSMASFGIFPFVAPYCASKRALDILFNSMMLELKRDIKVVSIKPGVIATPLWGKSIAVNKESIMYSEGYEKEMEYMVANARKNETQGLDVKRVIDLIIKVDKLDKPKPSYVIGFDANMAEIFSGLPQWALNAIIKFGLKKKLKGAK